MSQITAIGWCDSTVNPVMGCDGCELWNGVIKTCYAGQLHERYGGSKGYAPTFEQPTMFPGRMQMAAGWPDLTGMNRKDKPWLDGNPRLIFISDMADAFSKSIPFEFLRNEIMPAVHASRHQWLWLTKQPKRMVEFSEFIGEWPANLWAGTSVTNQCTADLRIPQLLKIPAKVHFLSVEPLLEAVNLELWMYAPRNHRLVGTPELPAFSQINWVIVGGESGANRRDCGGEAICDAARQCVAAGVPVFVKQDCAFKPGQQGRIPNDVWARKEFPKL